MNNTTPQFRIGHATDHEAHTGCTVFLCPPGAIGGVDVRGLAPASRELALLSPYKSVQTINAVLLSGGSAFGLSAADGVMRYLAERNIGHPTPIRPVPIVAAASVYDLFLGGGEKLPDADMGYLACQNATLFDVVEQGNVGAGAGVTVGKWGGPLGMMKSGFGQETFREDSFFVSAAAVVNSIGDVLNEDGTVLAGARLPNGRWRVEMEPYRKFPEIFRKASTTNTTLVVVMTNAKLDKVETNRIAQRAQDGLAIAVRPVHTSHDGDISFTLASGEVDVPFDYLGNIVVGVVAEAIRNAARYSRSVGETAGYASDESGVVHDE